MPGDDTKNAEDLPPAEGFAPPPEEPRPLYPTLRQIAVLMASLPLSFLIQVAIFPTFPRLSVVASGACMLGVAVVFVRGWGLAPRRVLLLHGIGAGVVLHAVLLTAVLAVLLAEVQALIASFWPLPGRLVETMEGLLEVKGGGDFVVSVIALSLFPAVSEEVLFRGLVLTGLRRRFGAPGGVAASGALFAVAHLNPWQFIPLLLIGVFIGFIVHRTDSLYTGIVAHGANNLFSLAAMNLGRRYGAESLNPQAHLPPAVVLSALVLFAAGMASFIVWTRRES